MSVPPASIHRFSGFHQLLPKRPATDARENTEDTILQIKDLDRVLPMVLARQCYSKQTSVWLQILVEQSTRQNNWIKCERTWLVDVYLANPSTKHRACG